MNRALTNILFPLAFIVLILSLPYVPTIEPIECETVEYKQRGRILEMNVCPTKTDTLCFDPEGTGCQHLDKLMDTTNTD